MSTFDAALGYSVAVLVGAGGTMGYVKAKSIPSLVSGLAFGAMIAFGTHKASNKKSPALVCGAALVLLGVMGKKYLASGKFMPAGLMSVLSIGLLINFAPRMFM